jgi:peptidoglycan hydrolase-like protein with peptidoglycan-binding domain
MRFNEFKESGFKLVDPTGRIGPEIADVLKALIALGFKLPQHGVDGVRGPETSAAVKEFQKTIGITVDGDPGPQTVAELNKVLASQGITFAKSTDADVKAPKSITKVDTSTIQDPDFNKKLKKVADSLGIKEADLRAIIRNESNFDPTAQDPNHVSAGLIGFTEKTARSLGTSKAEIVKMSAVEQLDLVYRFYKMVGVEPGMDRGSIYMLTFMPAFAKSPDSTVLGKRGGGDLILPSGKSSGLSMDKVWSQNPMFGKSRGRDSFTIGDVKNNINSR